MQSTAEPRATPKRSRVALFRVRTELPARTRTALGWGMIALILLAWVVVTAANAVPALLLPSPMAMVEGGLELARKGDLLPSVLVTLGRIGQALLLVIAVGVPLGVLMGSFPVFDALLEPVVSAAKGVPTTAFIALVILWFGIEEKAKIVFLFLGAIFYMLLLVRDAVLGVREELVRTALDLGSTGARTIFSVLVPGAMPRIWDGIVVCNGIMWTYVVLAEFINAKSGLGYLINIAGRLQRSDQVFAGVLLIGVISGCTDWLLRRAKARWFSY